MYFPRGRFDSIMFSEDDNSIVMKDWVIPTLYNAGNQNVIFNGQIVSPGEVFDIGPPNVRLNGTFDLRFEGTGKRQAIINYVIVEETAKNNQCN